MNAVLLFLRAYIYISKQQTTKNHTSNQIEDDESEYKSFLLWYPTGILSRILST